MKQHSSHLKQFTEALLGLSEDALLFSRHYVDTSSKEPRNPDLSLFFEHALTVVHTFQQQLHTVPQSPAPSGKYEKKIKPKKKVLAKKPMSKKKRTKR